MSKEKIIYLIPTFNEKENIADMLNEVDRVMFSLKKYTYKILVVDDDSPDGTGKIVKTMIKKNDRFVLISGPKNGLGAAMAEGINYAIKSLNADIIVSNEADFSFSPDEVPKMIKLLEKGNDAVFGSRILKTTSRWSKIRQFVHYLADKLFARIIAGVTEVNDHDSAFRAIRVKNILDKMDFSQFPTGYAFFNYQTFKILHMTDRIKELFVSYKPRVKGESKVDLTTKYFWNFINNSLEYIFICFRIRFEKILK